MAIIYEAHDSRETTVGWDNSSVDLKYFVEGTEDDSQVHALVQATIPQTYTIPSNQQIVILQNYRIAHLGGGVWEVTAHYDWETPRQTGYSSYTFDTTGGTAKILQSIKTTGLYGLPGTNPPNFNGAIGVTQDSIEGVEITIPIFNFKETHYLSQTVVTDSYKQTLFQLTGTVNNDFFRGFAPGEVLFLGASGSLRHYNDDWEITFSFAVSPNNSQLMVGGIGPINKLGWDYLWVLYDDVVDPTSHRIVKKPVAVYTEQVYNDGDFSQLGIGT